MQQAYYLKGLVYKALNEIRVLAGFVSQTSYSSRDRVGFLTSVQLCLKDIILSQVPLL